MTVAERQRKKRERDRERNRRLGVATTSMELAASERQTIADMAEIRGFEDQTEYLLSLVYKDRDMSQKEKSE